MAVDLFKFAKGSLRRYTNGRVSTTGNKPISGNYLHIDLEETSEYAMTQTRTLRGNILIRQTRANWISLWISSTWCFGLARSDLHQADTGRVDYRLGKQMVSGAWSSTTDP